MVKVFNANKHYDRLFVISDGEKYVCIDLEMPSLEVYYNDSVTHLKVSNGNYSELAPSDERYQIVISKYLELQGEIHIDELLPAQRA
jgi:hypothetical protein